MTDTKSDQQEPSMEEILASIRRIISEDGEEEEGEATATEEDAVAEPDPLAAAEDVEGEAAPEPFEEAPEEEAEDVLVLTDMIDEEVESEEEIATDDSELALEEVEPDPEPEPEPEPAPMPEPAPEPMPEPIGEDEALLSFEAEEQSGAAIADLVSTIGAHAAIGGGDKTLEAVTKELLRPLLKEWLDANLPGIVERIVREEIERVVAKSR